MGQIRLRDLEKRIKSPLWKRAVKLNKESRVYKIDRGQRILKALVLSDLQPENVEAYLLADLIQYNCSCLDDGICVHILALLLKTPDYFPDFSEVLKDQPKQKNTDIGQAIDAALFDLNSSSDLPKLLDETRARRGGKKLARSNVEPGLFDFLEPEPVDLFVAPSTELPPPDRDSQPWALETQTHDLSEKIVKCEPDFALELSEIVNLACFRLSIRYAGIEIPPQETTKHYKSPYSNEVIERNFYAESIFRDALREFIGPHIAFERGPYAAAMGSDAPDFGLDLSLADFLIEYGEELLQKGFDLSIKGQKLVGSSIVKLTIKQETSWFEVSAAAQIELDGKLETFILEGDSELPGFAKTKKGLVAISKRDIEKLNFLKRSGINSEGVLQTSSLSMSLIELLYENSENRVISAVQDGYERLSEISAIQEFAYHSARTGDQDIPAHIDIPESPRMLKARLRTYQLLGFAWLEKLHASGYGACLADDMGLGKTIQTLALIAKLKEGGQLSSSLLVAPVVTLGNWEKEIEKFLPDLNFVRHQGIRRLKDSQELRQYDLVIVSYQTLRNDLDLFAGHEWDLLILDEAHYIKSASSQIFKAIRSISGRHRISLTGTPIENNTGELWAQFSFLNPGLLGDQKQFYEQFALPIEKKSDEFAAQSLRKLVHPYILRRKKQDVLSELPDKTEKIEYIEMDSEQARVYELYRRRFEQIVNGLIESQGFEQSRMEVFRYILKLRQLAIIPSLANEELVDIPSAKLEALTLMLEDLEPSGNKILIFSQFTKTLECIAKRLKENSWDYALLTGETTNRDAVIEQFKTDPNKRVFLLSLKAGGVGINLTMANYVVLFDPWWNPAAESQAIDRAYRMGQTQKVTAYRFITKNTIEEKILAMQERKTELSEMLVGTQGGQSLSLNAHEVRNLFSST